MRVIYSKIAVFVFEGCQSKSSLWYKEQKFIFPQSSGLEVQDEGVNQVWFLLRPPITLPMATFSLCPHVVEKEGALWSPLTGPLACPANVL